jgi:hypothetical protein
MPLTDHVPDREVSTRDPLIGPRPAEAQVLLLDSARAPSMSENL